MLVAAEVLGLAICLRFDLSGSASMALVAGSSEWENSDIGVEAVGTGFAGSCLQVDRVD